MGNSVGSGGKPAKVFPETYSRSSDAGTRVSNQGTDPQKEVPFIDEAGQWEVVDPPRKVSEAAKALQSPSGPGSGSRTVSVRPPRIEIEEGESYRICEVQDNLPPEIKKTWESYRESLGHAVCVLSEAIPKDGIPQDHKAIYEKLGKDSSAMATRYSEKNMQTIVNQISAFVFLVGKLPGVQVQSGEAFKKAMTEVLIKMQVIATWLNENGDARVVGRITSEEISVLKSSVGALLKKHCVHNP